MQNNYTCGNQAYSQTTVQEITRRFMGQVYNWMTMGLAITALASWIVSGVMADDMSSIFWQRGTVWTLFILELALVFAISFFIEKMAPAVAVGCFLVYSVLSGISLAPIFFVYAGSDICAAFFSCAGMYAVTSVFGYVTKKNLSGIGNICFMGLVGIVIASIINIFLVNDGLTMIISYIGVAVFTGLTAWDTQKLRQMAADMSEDALESGEVKKMAVLGALELYLDFLNLFLCLLRIIGGGGSRR